MQRLIKYTIFKTRWGYFGLAASEFGLLRTCLPLAKSEKVKSVLLKDRPIVNRELTIEFDKKLFRSLQEQVIAYFEGAAIDFDKNIPFMLDGYSLFTRQVLIACRDIKFGQTVSYGRLAEMAGKPRSARAVGGALAKNPLPLIIPCHRVIRNDGKIGGFSAQGGVTLKKRMLELECWSSRQ